MAMSGRVLIQMACMMAGCVWADSWTTFSVTNAHDAGGGASGTLPVGAGAFEIERPRAHGGPALNAADFGFSVTNDDNAAALARAFAEAKRVGASRLDLPPGTYRCFGGGVRADGLRDFTFDGHGAVLVFRRSARQGGGANLVVADTERCVFRNFKMDWDWTRDPLASIGTCVNTFVDEKNDDASYFDMKLDRPHPCYPALPSLQTATTVDAARRHLIGTPPNRLIFLGNAQGPKSAWIAPDTLRIWPGVKPSPDAKVPATYQCYYNPKANRGTVRQIPVGISYRLLHYYYGLGGITMHGNRHFTLEDVDIWSCRGHGLAVGGEQHHWQVVNVRLAPPEDKLSERLTSSTSDGHHVSRSLGWCKYVNFTVSFCNDDSHNFHDCTAYGVPEAPDRLRVTGPRGIGYLAPKVGDTVELRENNFDATGWRGTIVKIAGDTMSMDRPVPRPKGDRFLFFNRSVATDHILMKGCVCRDSHFRNLFQSNDLTIEDCVFDRMGSGAVQFAGDWTVDLWSEGMGVTNCVVRNCLFRDGNQQSRGRDGGWGAEILSFLRIPSTVKHAPPSPGFFSDILVENCRFENPAGLLVSLIHARNVTFRNNVTVDDGLVPNRQARTGGFLFRNCQGVTVESNRWELADGLAEPTFSISADTSNVVCRGNVLTRIGAPLPPYGGWMPSKRWCGFNLLGMFILRDPKHAPLSDPTFSRTAGHFSEDEFRWMHDWGFNFARLPLDYRYWIKDGDWHVIDEEEVKKLDEAIAYGRKWGVHVQLCLHRAPGYCINPPREPKDLFTDADALAACARHWSYFARRYRGIPNDELTFNLFNEPPGRNPERYERVARALVCAIRQEDPDRFIIADGLEAGRGAFLPLARLPGVGQGVHSYDPPDFTHYQASWWNRPKGWPRPVWPPKEGGQAWVEAWFAKRGWDNPRMGGVFTHVGEFGCYIRTPHPMLLAWLEDNLRVWKARKLGFVMWNLRGPFGILDSGRKDVEYEDFEGHKLDRKMLDILRRYAEGL